MDIHIQYLEPKRKDICVAFCFFNPCGYIRPLQNLLFFENKLKAANIPYFSIEMVIGDQPPMLANPTLRVYSKSSMFYKEALWNRLEKEIPPEYTKVCFLDSDIIYQRVDWLDSLSMLLDTHDIVHPFSILKYLDLSYNLLKGDEIMNTMSYVAKSFITTNKISPSAPGLGWALTRSFFNRMGGFFDKNLVGSSDQIFCGSILKNAAMLEKRIHPLINDSVTRYFNHIYNLSYSLTYLYCETLHLYHGTLKNRQYILRENLIKDITNNWDATYAMNQDGFWELKDTKLNQDFYTYFINRAEDGLIANQLVNPIHIQYLKPKRKDICVAFALFNSCQYVRPIQNMLFFMNKLRLAGIPYYSIEMVIGNSKPVLVNPTLRFYSKSPLFYKEALWNRLEKEIPSEYSKICFLDSDIVFERDNWLDTISEMLDTYDIIHPFETAQLLNISFRANNTMTSSIKYDNVSSHGYGWAIRRDFFSRIGGFFDMCILGGGDELFYISIRNIRYKHTVNPIFKLLATYYEAYNKEVEVSFPMFSYLKSNIFHLFHGAKVNRKYLSRYEILKDVKWESAFIKNSDGFWESMDETINIQCLEYFKNRGEDSITDVINEIKLPLPVSPAPVNKMDTVPKSSVPTPMSISARNDAKIKAIIEARNLAKTTTVYNNPQRNIQVKPFNMNVNNPSILAANKALQRKERILNTIQYDRTVVLRSEDEDDE